MSSPSRPTPVLRTPRWLVGHALVLVTVVLFASLGLWQLDRLEQRREHNALLSERMAQPPLSLDDIADADADAIAYRRVVATGTYAPDAEVLRSTRSHRGRPGHHLLTLLRGGGTAIVVNRGWVPLEEDDPPVAVAAPPDGEVTVTGLVLPSFEARRSGRLDGGAGAVQFVSDVDLTVLGDAMGEPIAPVWLLAAEQAPAQPGPLPLPADPPELTEGSHLSYAAQWFLFALVVVIGYPLLLRRTVRDQGDADARPTTGDPEPAPAVDEVTGPPAPSVPAG